MTITAHLGDAYLYVTSVLPLINMHQTCFAFITFRSHQQTLECASILDEACIVAL